MGVAVPPLSAEGPLQLVSGKARQGFKFIRYVHIGKGCHTRSLRFCLVGIVPRGRAGPGCSCTPCEDAYGQATPNDQPSLRPFLLCLRKQGSEEAQGRAGHELSWSPNAGARKTATVPPVRDKRKGCSLILLFNAVGVRCSCSKIMGKFKACSRHRLNGRFYM